jgi:hypothetical protein
MTISRHDTVTFRYVVEVLCRSSLDTIDGSHRVIVASEADVSIAVNASQVLESIGLNMSLTLSGLLFIVVQEHCNDGEHCNDSIIP